MKKNIYAPLALLLLGLFFCLPSATQAAFTYGKYITIYESQIPGTAALTDFPVLVSVVDPDLRSVANGGYVESANGYDIQFRLSDGTTVLSHQVERYDAATGTLVAWVKVPSLSATTNTFLLMYYGDATVVANPSSNNTWDASYMNVWHFENSVANASAGAAALTDVNTTHLATGKIAGARDLDNNTNVLSSVATGKHLRLSNGAFVGVNNFTFEGWVYLDRATTNWERIFDFGQGVNVNFFLTPSSGNAAQGTTNARITINTNVNEQGPVVANALNTGAWIHWAVVLDDAANTMQIYKNGALFGATAAGVTLTPASIEATTNNFFGRSQYGGDNYIDAKFDEFRLSSTNRSGSWITASYNNQNSPSTFMLISGQYSASALTGIAPAGIQGQWSVNAAWPIAAVHMANLPNGKVMVWDDTQDDGAGNFNTVGPYHLSIWDPATNTHSTGPIRERNPANNQLFCAAHAQLPNGNVLAVTGEINVSDPLTMMYDWRTDKWSKLANLNYGRYYPSATALSDGGILVTGGWTSYKPANERPAAWYPEIFKNGKWTALTTGQLPFGATPQEFIDNRTYFPWMQQAPNGEVFYAGPEAQMFYLNTQGTGAVTQHGNRDAHWRDYGSYATYDIGKILVAGGGNSVAETFKIDINGGAPVVSASGSMAFARRQQNLSLLADGTVVVTGGYTGGTNAPDPDGQFNLANSVYAAEIWNPATNTWKTMASMTQPRAYHSSAILLPDGRVVTGGGICGPCFASGHNEVNAEIFSPPYLFNLDGTPATRPVIDAAPTVVNYGQAFNVTFSNSPASIQKVHLIKLSSVTHATNFDQRLVPLTFSASGNTLSLTGPANANIAPPGYYMLFIVNSNGTPSEARTIQIGNLTEQDYMSTNMRSKGLISFKSYNYPTYFISHEGLAATASISVTGVGSTDQEKLQATFRIVRGLGDENGFSFEAVDAPGSYLRANGLATVQLDTYQNTQQFKDDATFYVGTGWADPNTFSLESKSNPGYYLRHFNYLLTLAQANAGSPAIVKADVSFTFAPPVGGQTLSVESLDYVEHFIRHTGYVGYVNFIGAQSTAGEKNDASFKVVPGIGDAAGVSFESVNFPGYYLRINQPSNTNLVLTAFANTTLFKDQATFYPRQGWANSTQFSLESKSNPGSYIKHSTANNVTVVSVSGASSATDKQQATFSFEAAAGLGTNASFPVEWVSFTANPVNNEHVALKWETASEKNNDFFRIERSSDGQSWSALGTVKGAGNSSLPMQYTFTDYLPVRGVSFYRLAQIDVDGAESYSDVEQVVLGLQSSGLLVNVFPNPVPDGTRQLFINLDVQEAGDARFEMYNAVGQLLLNQTSSVSRTENQVRLDLGKLSSGVYMLKAVYRNRQEITRIVID